jgi:cytochrome P450 family 110
MILLDLTDPRSGACFEDAWPVNTLPPGPTAPPSEQARLWLERPLELLEQCFHEYGDIFRLTLGSFGTIVIVSHPDAVRAIFGAPRDLFESRHFNESYRYVMGAGAIFLQDGPSHLRIRRIMMPQFRRDRVRDYVQDVGDATNVVLKHWSTGETYDVRPLIHEITLRVLLKIVFGRSEAAIEAVLGWFRSRVWRDMRAWKPWTSLSRLHPEIRQLITDELTRRRNRSGPDGDPDLLDGLKSAHDDEGKPLVDEEIQDQVLTLMITAGDAVAVAISWALYWAARSPEAQQKVRAELGTLGPSPDPVDVSQQPYLSAMIQEVLRLNTVLPTVSGRRLTAPLVVLGYPLEAGVTLAPCEYLVHRRADVYPEPLAFRPERFLGREYGPHEYFPFGGGHRSCLGGSLAPLEMKLVLAAILSRWELTLPDQDPIEVVRMGTLLAPSEGLKVKVHSAG